MEENAGPPPFGAVWARALKAELAGSAEFRRAAAGWHGRLVLEWSADPAAGDGTPRAVALELADGDCREARPAEPADHERAAFVIAGAPEAWRQVLGGGRSPLAALLRGKLRLVKGSIAALTPFAAAASQLAQVAARLGVTGGGPAAEPAGPDEGYLPFRSTGPGGLRFDSPPMQLFQKAKRDGIWDPQAIDFSRDRLDWQRLDDGERDVLLRLAALFGAGEESVTRELLPLIRVIAREGRLEEELFLAAFLWEEAKHVETFRLFFDQVAGEQGDLNRYHTPSYRRIFYDELPAAMAQLESDPSPVAQARASTTYNLIVEGVLAETGYHVYHSILERNGILPGMQQAVVNLQRDESRHLAFGVYLLSRLVSEHGEPVWRAIEERMDELLEPAVEIIREVFALYDPPPFGLQPAVFVDFAVDQFRRRLARVERAWQGGSGEPAPAAGG